MKKRYSLVILLFAMIGLFACSKDEETGTGDNFKARFITPLQGATYNENDTLWLKVDMSADDVIHDYQLTLKNLTENTLVYEYNGHSHNNNTSTALWTFPKVNQHSLMELTLTRMSHDGVVTVSKVSFHVNDVSSDNGPDVYISKPLGNETYADGNRVQVSGDISSLYEMQNAFIKVLRNNDTIPQFYAVLPVNNLKQANFDTSFVIQTGGQSHSTFIITVGATNQNGKSNSKSISLHID